MRSLIISGVFLMSFLAQAEFSGHWVGVGKVKDALEKEIPCSSVKFSVKQTASLLSIADGEFICSPLEMRWYLPDFRVESGNIYFQNEKIGNIASDRIKFNFKDPNENLLKKIELVLEENKITYREFWINEGSNSAFMTFSARLASDRL